jgi:Amt family ammonium transporter
MHLRWYLSLFFCLGVLSMCAAPGVALAQDEPTDAPAGNTAPADDAATDDAKSDDAAADNDATAGGEDEEAVVPKEGDLVADLPENERMDYTINTLIMFVCAVLVLFMQAGFAMLEVGLNAAKNTVNILFKNVMDLSVGVLLFLFIGYSLMYPGTTIIDGYLGSPSAFIERDAQVEDGKWTAPPVYDDDGAAYASNSADFLFQVAFAATAATIVSGCVAGRMKFASYLIYSGFLTGLIYPISGYWKWGGGFLDAMGFQDFAGSVVVHAVGGFAGLAGAIVLGPRLGRFVQGKSIPMPGHNIAFAALGVFILWIGWYGFNPGSQLYYTGAVNAEATTYIALTTTIAASAGAVAAMIIAWCLFGKPDVTMALNGALAGLVGITANCNQMTQVNALIVGLVAGLLVVAGIMMLDKLRIDDPVGAWPVHGLCGIWGGIATGLFGSSLPTVDGTELTRMQYIGVQSLSTLIICAWAFLTMLVLFLILRAAGILRVSPEEEMAGLDVSEHGMHAYPPSQIVEDKYTPTATSA